MSSILDRAIDAVARARAPKEPPVPAGPAVADEALERPICPVCGATRATKVAEATDTWVADSVARGQVFAIVRCGVCATRYTTPRYRYPHRHRAFGGSYPFYARARAARSGGDSANLEAELAMFESRARMVSAHAPRPGRLLDIGCGDGVFMEAMRRRGWDVVGIDIEEDVVWHAQQRLDLDCRKADAEVDPLPAGPFDAVTLWGMLQLSYAPHRLLDRLRGCLDPDGVLAIGVSNVQSVGARLFGKHWRGYGVPRHLVHFTPSTLSNLVQWAGYDVAGIAYETPKWITAGTVDDMFYAPNPAARVARTTWHWMSQLAATTDAAETMALFARPKLERTNGAAR